MKKITCIQQYVIDNLIENEKLSTNSLLDAVSKVCSKEQYLHCENQCQLCGAYIQTMYDNSCKCYYII